MSDASFAVTYTFVYTDFEPWRYYGEESAETRSLIIITMWQTRPGGGSRGGPEDNQAYYLTDGGDGDDEPFDDENNDDDTDFDPDEDPEEELFKDEEEHLASVDSYAVPIVDLVLPVRDTEALEANEPTPIPRSSIIIPLS
nr:hypothetical protein [Tanacetum cinerariifolium]